MGWDGLPYLHIPLCSLEGSDHALDQLVDVSDAL